MIISTNKSPHLLEIHTEVYIDGIIRYGGFILKYSSGEKERDDRKQD